MFRPFLFAQFPPLIISRYTIGMEMHDATTLVSWEAPEYTYVKNSADWFWLVIGIGVILTALGIITQNYLLTFLVVLSTLLIVRYSTAQPGTITTSISEVGFIINDRSYPFETLTGFWFERDRHGHVRLLLAGDDDEITAVVPAPDDSENQDLRELLLQFIPEIPLSESWVQKIIDRIGF